MTNIGSIVTNPTSSIDIRDIGDLREMHAVEELQKEIWRIPDLEVVPLTHLIAAKTAGGVLIGAFESGTLVGFVYGFPSYEHGQLGHHSHMLAVKSAYRNVDLGRRLKLAQRERVLEQRITFITWTFDPLQSLNAHFNFNKLGVIADRYLINFYGEDAPSFLHQTGTDRLWVTWFLNSLRVKQRLEGTSGNRDFEQAAPLVQVELDHSPLRKSLVDGLSHDYALIEIPGDINTLQQQSRETALSWREATRSAFSEALNAGFVVADFYREKRGHQQIGKYLLSREKLIGG